MLSEDVLRRIKANLAAAFPGRLRGVMLYGSEARDQAACDSDIDLLVLLSAPVVRGEDLRTCIHALYPLVLELDRPIHAKPVDIADYEAQIFPLYREARREGMLV